MSIWYYICTTAGSSPAGSGAADDAERQQHGPLSTDELKQLLRLQVLDLDTLVWRDGMLHWRPLRDLAQQLNLVDHVQPVEALAVGPGSGSPPMPPPPPAPPPPHVEQEPAAPPTSGRAVFNLGSDPSEPPTPVAMAEQPRDAHVPETAALNPYQPSRASLSARSARFDDDGVVYAGFWKRAAALIVDSVVIGIVGGFGGEALGSLLGDLAGGSELAVAVMVVLSTQILYLAYFAFFHSAVNGATPGKLLIGIKVVRSNGEGIGFWHAVGRYFATIPSTLILGIGYLMAAFTSRKRTLHDMICDTVVVDRYAFTRHAAMQQQELGTAATVVLVLGFVLLLAMLVLVLFLGIGAGLLLR